MRDTLNAAELRRRAMRCSARASDSDCMADERDRLLTIREALLSLADNADWLIGRPAKVAPSRPPQQQKIAKSA
jgi:hypothetical protein